MPIVFVKAPSDVLDLLNQVMQEHHQPLVYAKVNVGVVMQSKFDEDDQEVPSLKVHGAYAAACIKVVSRKNRLDTDADAKITIDDVIWKTLSPRCKNALLSHELTHLVLKMDTKTGKPKVDDMNRPVLGMIPDDFTLTGFLSVVTAHGDAALEYQSVTRIHFAVQEALKRGSQTMADELKAKDQVAKAEQGLTELTGTDPIA